MSQSKPFKDSAVDAVSAIAVIILVVVTAVYWVSHQ